MRELDPAIVGDVAGDLNVDAGNVSTLDAFVAQLHPAQIPVPPGVKVTSPIAADPTLSLVIAAPQVVSINLDDPHPMGSTGLISATLALKYDPSVLSVAPTDITLGSIPSAGSGWQLTSVVDKAMGRIGIQLYSATPVTATQGSSLVDIAFHILPGAKASTTAVQLVNAAAPNGQWFGTVLADSQGGLILSPGVDQVMLPTGSENVSATTSASPESTDVTRPASRQVAVDALVQDYPQQSGETTSRSVGTEDVVPDAFVKSIPIGGGTTPIISASVLADGSLGFPVATTAGSQTFQIGNLPALNTLLYWNSPAQMMAEQMFQALARRADALNDRRPVDQPLRDLVWDAGPRLDWLDVPSQSQAVVTQPGLAAEEPDQQANDQHGVPDNTAVDKAFADLVNDTGEFGDS